VPRGVVLGFLGAISYFIFLKKSKTEKKREENTLGGQTTNGYPLGQILKKKKKRKKKKEKKTPFEYTSNSKIHCSLHFSSTASPPTKFNGAGIRLNALLNNSLNNCDKQLLTVFSIKSDSLSFF
jgi:hypothetical protein